MKMKSALVVLAASAAVSLTLAMWTQSARSAPERAGAPGDAGTAVPPARERPPAERGSDPARVAANAPVPGTAAEAGAVGAPGTGTGTGEDAAKPAAAAPPADGAEPAAQEPIVTESLARNAMLLVGKDPVAEAIWLRAINDPDMPKNARVDLIEDIADEGFSNPMTKADLPLVEARLRLIERLTPLAMDEVNRVSFGEAYKDLIATLARLRGAGGR
jgi:hypothetical protein